MIEKTFEDEKGQFHVIGRAATKDLDLQGDVITLEAMELSSQDLIQNSTVLFNHDDNAPIGKVTEQTMDAEGTVVDIIIDKDAKIPETGSNVISLIKQGILNKFSIRAKVLDMVREFVQDVGRTVNVINRMLLLEVSLVSVPANPHAKALEWYVSKALADVDEATKALTHTDEMDDEEPDWGDVDKSELPRNAFADQGDPDLKSTWRFPHHWVRGGQIGENDIFESGDLLLHRGGLNAAFAAAQGARSGEEASEEVMEHLRAHRVSIGLESEEGEEAALSNDNQDEDTTKMDKTDRTPKTETDEAAGAESEVVEFDTIKSDDGEVRISKADGTIVKGMDLGAWLNEQIDAMVTDDMSRGAVVEAAGSAAGIAAGTVNQIASGNINCPPLGRLEGFADFFGVSVDTIIGVAEGDGCEYNAETSAPTVDEDADQVAKAAKEAADAEKAADDNPPEVVSKGFPPPVDLLDLWKTHCEANSISKATPAADVLTSWHTFCKDSGFPHPFPFPYPQKNFTAIDGIIEIAEDLMRNDTQAMVDTGAELKRFALELAENEVPEPSEIEESAPAAKAEESATDDEPEAKDEDAADDANETKKGSVKRKGLVPSGKTDLNKTEEFKKKLEAMEPAERLLALCQMEEAEKATS